MNEKKHHVAFGNFLKLYRTKMFKSAREFCSEAKLDISYPQYSRYENGEQTPSLEQTLHFVDTLSMPLMDTLLKWIECQISIDRFSAIKSHFSKTSQPLGLNLDQVFTFNHAHLKIFLEYPESRDLFTLMNQNGSWVRDEALAHAVSISSQRLNLILDAFHLTGIIDRKDGYSRTSKELFYFPDDIDFFDLKNRNVKLETQKLLSNSSKETLDKGEFYRFLVSKNFTHEQFLEIKNEIDLLCKKIIHLETSPDASQAIYSLCFLGGKRFDVPLEKNKINNLDGCSVDANNLDQTGVEL